MTVPGGHICAAGEAAEIYIRIHNKETADVHLAFSLDSSGVFAQDVVHSQILLGILYGMPLALAFSALTGWLVSRDRRFSEQLTHFEDQVIEHTLSIGYTIFNERPSDKELTRRMREADQALYAAKTAGRNCVIPFAAAA